VGYSLPLIEAGLAKWEGGSLQDSYTLVRFQHPAPTFLPATPRSCREPAS
jgi:hypothetical protein